MAKNCLYYLHQYWVDIQDPRTKHYPLVDVSPWTIANIMFGYYFFVTRIGPQLMKNRRPFSLRKLMLCYNLLMIAINGYFFARIIPHLSYARLTDWTYPSRSDFSSYTLEEIQIGYMYWLSKFVDWFDTLLYVLRAKQSHISFLHLYHHISVPVFGYLIIKINCLIPGALLFVLINSFIHTFMYAYYALSTLHALRPYLWWKRYITVMQLTQFAIGIAYGSVLFLKQTGYPPVWLYFGLTQPPLFFAMFYNFYRNAYNKLISNNNHNNNNNQIDFSFNAKTDNKKSD